MKNPLFFLLLSVPLALLGLKNLASTQYAMLESTLTAMQETLRLEGWHFTKRQKRSSLQHLMPAVELLTPSVSDAEGHSWTGDSLVLSRTFLHPLSLSFTLAGNQVLHVGRATMTVHTVLTGRYMPDTHTLTFETPVLSITGIPGKIFNAAILHNVSAQLLIGTERKPDTTRWALSMSAHSAQIQIGPDSSPLLASLPPPKDLHVIATAVRGAAPTWTRKAGYTHFLIQDASARFGPLSATLKGRLSPTGKGTLWAHLSGLQDFVRYWIAHAPTALRQRSNLTQAFTFINRQTRKVPDRLDLPVPVNLSSSGDAIGLSQ